jgi:hypothetical protein
LTKRGLILQLEEKVQAMDLGVQRFFSKIEALQKKGLPSLKVINDKLMTLPDYKKRLTDVAKDIVATPLGSEHIKFITSHFLSLKEIMFLKDCKFEKKVMFRG